MYNYSFALDPNTIIWATCLCVSIPGAKNESICGILHDIETEQIQLVTTCYKVKIMLLLCYLN